MARPPKYDWKSIRLDLESGMTHEYVHKKHKVPYDTLNRHLKRNPIEVNQAAKGAINDLDKVSQVICQVEEKRPDIAKNIVDIAAERNEYIRYFTDSAMRGQRIANNALGAVERMHSKAKTDEERDAVAISGLSVAKDHAAITSKNKETVLGKDQAGTTVNVQTNVGIKTFSELYGNPQSESD